MNQIYVSGPWSFASGVLQVVKSIKAKSKDKVVYSEKIINSLNLNNLTMSYSYWMDLHGNKSLRIYQEVCSQSCYGV